MPFRTFLWKNWQQYSRMRCIDGSFHQEHGRRNFSFSSRSLCLTPTLSLHRARPLWERRYKSVFTSHDAIVSRSGERIVTRNFLSAIIHALCWNISFPIFLFFSTLPFSLLCTSAVDKCYCVDTLKRALFRNFLFLCLYLSASFSLWLIF